MLTLEIIRQKTQDLNLKTRRTLLGGMTTALLVAGLSGFGIAWSDTPLLKVAFASVILWTMAGQYFLNRGVRSASPPEGHPSTPGLESYRHEVQRRRYLSGHFLLWSFGPIALAVAGIVALIIRLATRNQGMLVNGAVRKMMPFLTLVVVWTICVFIIRLRDQRQLQREIEELENIERGNK
jgi:hypothetical protein